MPFDRHEAGWVGAVVSAVAIYVAVNIGKKLKTARDPKDAYDSKQQRSRSRGSATKHESRRGKR